MTWPASRTDCHSQEIYAVPESHLCTAIHRGMPVLVLTDGRKENSADCFSFWSPLNILVRRHQHYKNISRCHRTDRLCMLNIYHITSIVTKILSSWVCKVILRLWKTFYYRTLRQVSEILYTLSYMYYVFYLLCMYVRITYTYIMFVYLATAASPSNPLDLFKYCSDFYFFSLFETFQVWHLTLGEVSGFTSTDDFRYVHMHLHNNHWI